MLIIEEAQTNTEKRKIVEKLHKQFGHSNPEKLKSLLKDAGNSDPELSINMVDEICEKCEVCLKSKKRYPKPVVAYPLAREFNETVVLDLHELDSNLYYAHFLDHVTRLLSGAATIGSKDPGIVLNKFLQHWVSLHDRQGRFSQW